MCFSQHATTPMMTILQRLPGGPKTLVAFVAILFAYTTQTESMQRVQNVLGYSKPLFLLYVTHSSFIFLLPIQLLVLCAWNKKRPSYYFALLQRDLAQQAEHVWKRILYRTSPLSSLALASTFALILLILTTGITIPAISWFIAVPLTSMANITAIYNTFSIWALVFSILFLGSPWDLRQAIAVLLGVFGVVLVAFGSMRKGQDTVGAQDAVISYALLGNALALLGALSMAAYEIMYKIIGSTSEDEHKGFQPVASSAEHADAGDTQGNETEAQPALPFGMHPIAMTTGIGFVTLTVFWIPLIIAHITGAEVIVAPPNWETAWWILLGIVCGVIFNGCFTILLGLWGPVLASMSCLMTTVLVQLTDLALGVPSTWINLGGCAIITVSFVLLLPWGQQGE